MLKLASNAARAPLPSAFAPNGGPGANLDYKMQSSQPVAPTRRIMLGAWIGSDSRRGRCVFSTEQALQRVVVLLSVVIGGIIPLPSQLMAIKGTS